MKAIIKSLILIVLITNNIDSYAQYFWWYGQPEPLTDSLSDNINPHLFFNGTSFYMTWEKPVDSMTTAIWFRDITAQTPDVELISTPNVHYKTPKMLGFWFSPEFYLFYETNEAGNNDIYYLINDGLGNFSDPMAFAATPSDENSFYPDHGVYYGMDWENPGMVWIKDQSVYYAVLNNYIFSDPVLIDSGNCYNPIITDYGSDIVWEKEDTSFRYLAYSNGGGTNWAEPDTVFYGSHCTNLKADKINRSGIVFSFQVDSVWDIGIGIKNGYNYQVDTLGITKETPFAPAITTYWIPLDNSWFWWEGFITFPFPEDSTEEIYLNQEPWIGSQFLNFSQLGTISRNPDFFYSPHPDPQCDGIYLVWESYQNNHWQLYYSLEMQQCYGAIDELAHSTEFIKTHPNPFSNETTIEFTLDTRERVVVDVYNYQGLLMTQLTDQVFDAGTQQLRWNAHGLEDGVYILKMTVGDKLYTSKIIKAR